MKMIDQDSPIWQQRILNSLRSRVDASLGLISAIPVEAAGWMHQYVCPEHELPLIFDISSPKLHRCPHGEVIQGAAYDAAFLVFAHRFYAALARDAAVLFKATSDNKYFTAALEILNQYAAYYASFDSQSVGKPWMLPGKAFSQALTEAIWAVTLIQAFEILHTELSQSQQDYIKDNLLYPNVEVITQAHDRLAFQQDRVESNYNAWFIAALGCMGFVLNDKNLIERAIHGPGGFLAHLNSAVLSDGFEYEGSPYYHNFVTWAYTILAETAVGYGFDLYGIQGENGQSIHKMWSALASLAWPDGSIPCIGDGNYWQNSTFYSELCQVYEIALSRTGDPHYAGLLNCAYSRGHVSRDSWAAFLYANQDIPDNLQLALDAVVLREIGLAVLRDSTQPGSLTALLRFGSFGSNHTHLDCLALLIYPFSMDAGNPPYGVDTRCSWYQQSAAHNTVIIDGQSQKPTDGRLLAWEIDSGCCTAWAGADEAYPGVQFSRKVTLETGRVRDHASLRADEPHTFDWILHTNVALNCEGLKLTPSHGTLFSDGAGSFIQLVSQGSCSGFLKANFEHKGQKYRLRLSSPNPLKIFLARCPQNGGVDSGKRFVLIARVHGPSADFYGVYEKV